MSGPMDQMGWWLLGLPPGEEDKTVVRLRVGQRVTLSWDPQLVGADTTSIQRVEWVSTAPDVVSLRSSGRLTAVLEGMRPGEVGPPSDPYAWGPLYASAFFSDGACVTVRIRPSEWKDTPRGRNPIRSFALTRVIVDP